MKIVVGQKYVTLAPQNDYEALQLHSTHENWRHLGLRLRSLRSLSKAPRAVRLQIPVRHWPRFKSTFRENIAEGNGKLVELRHLLRLRRRRAVWHFARILALCIGTLVVLWCFWRFI